MCSVSDFRGSWSLHCHWPWENTDILTEQRPLSLLYPEFLGYHRLNRWGHGSIMEGRPLLQLWVTLCSQYAVGGWNSQPLVELHHHFVGVMNPSQTPLTQHLPLSSNHSLLPGPMTSQRSSGSPDYRHVLHEGWESTCLDFSGLSHNTQRGFRWLVLPCLHTSKSKCPQGHVVLLFPVTP